MKNEEIMNVVEIMGLKFNVTYTEENIKTLRYGHLMIMADQDHDGSHIKGLVINFIHHFWPSLLDIPGFLQQFITPIVKTTKGKKSETFFTLPEYEEWKESTGNDAKGWHIKYYKGLGTSTSSEGEILEFTAVDRSSYQFAWTCVTNNVHNIISFEQPRIIFQTLTSTRSISMISALISSVAMTWMMRNPMMSSLLDLASLIWHSPRAR